MRITPLRLLAVLAAALVIATPSGADARHTLVGETAPELTARDWSRGDGRTEIAGFDGEMVLLAFWKTDCPASRSALPQLARLDEALRRKGLNVVGVTHEERATGLRYLVHRAPRVGFPMAFGGGSGYEVKMLPHAVLIDGNGTVQWEGRPGGLSKRDLEKQLRYLERADAETQAVIAGRMLARAETLVEAGRVLEATEVLDGAAERFARTEAAETAAARSQALREGDHEAEFAAQRRVAKLVGGVHGPAASKKRLKAKDLAKRAKGLIDLADTVEEEAPHAARIAREWAEIFRDEWTD